MEIVARMRDPKSQAVSDNGIQSYIDFLSSTDVSDYIGSLLQDCKDMNPLYRSADYLRDREQLLRRYHHEGLCFLTKTLPDLYDNLLVYLETGISAYPGFRLQRGENYPVFLRQLFQPIYDDPESEHSVLCMKLLYQLCVAFKKLKGPYKKSVLVKQLNEFKEVDASLNSFNAFTEHNKPILDKARNIIRQILTDLNPFDVSQSEKFIPKPGPGATNTPTEKHERYRPHMFDTQLADFNMEEWFRPPFHAPRGKRPWDLRVGKRPSLKLKERCQLTSRFKFVHKTFGKARGICIEQLEMQWLQQGIRKALYDRIENHPLSKGYVLFTDQSINGSLAQLSSRSRYMATIDMSSASDRISRKLVEYLFQDNEELLKALLALSTRIIELPEELSSDRMLMVNKYAPMGSALCFPVMGLVHFALIKSIISMTAPQHINDIPVYVYGDDIIIESSYAEEVMEKLPDFGMKINQKKSFFQSYFRESCGVHAYYGVNITPVRFKSIVHQSISVNDVVGLLKQEYDLFKKGYKKTAALIRSELLKSQYGRFLKLTVGTKSNLFGFIRDDDALMPLAKQCNAKRWNSDLQAYKYRLCTIVDLFDDVPPVDDGEYYLRKLVEQPKLTAKKIYGGSKGLSIQWKWHAASAIGYQSSLNDVAYG